MAFPIEEIRAFAVQQRRNTRSQLMVALCDLVLTGQWGGERRKPKRDRAAYMRRWRASKKEKPSPIIYFTTDTQNGVS